jgi:hypothetical protein
MKHLISKVVSAGASSILILASSQVLGATTNNGNSGGSTTLFSSFSTLLGPAQTGQPNQVCGETTPVTSPSAGAASAPGSPFSPGGVSGQVYAGTQTQNSKNSASVSQYDVACSKQPSGK